MERWAVLAGKALHRIRQERGEVSWLEGARVMKMNVQDKNRKTRTMANLGRWKVLIDGALNQAAKKKGMQVAFKWRRIVTKLLRNDTK